LVRENRLYQADWLLRFYGYNANEILDDEKPDFDLALDPKCDWALRNIELFPVEINKADYYLLLRVPGIGVRSARRIISARRFGSLDYEDLKKLGVVLKRARYFITCTGKHYGIKSMNSSDIRNSLLFSSKNDSSQAGEQLSLFSIYPQLLPTNDIVSTITGEF